MIFSFLFCHGLKRNENEGIPLLTSYDPSPEVIKIIKLLAITTYELFLSDENNEKKRPLTSSFRTLKKIDG